MSSTGWGTAYEGRTYDMGVAEKKQGMEIQGGTKVFLQFGETRKGVWGLFGWMPSRSSCAGQWTADEETMDNHVNRSTFGSLFGFEMRRRTPTSRTSWQLSHLCSNAGWTTCLGTPLALKQFANAVFVGCPDRTWSLVIAALIPFSSSIEIVSFLGSSPASCNPSTFSFSFVSTAGVLVWISPWVKYEVACALKMCLLMILHIRGGYKADETARPCPTHSPTPHAKVSMHKSNTLWEVLQLDIVNFMLETLWFIFSCCLMRHLILPRPASFFRHSADESRNATTSEIILALETHWVPHHGLPGVIRTDPEGSFRGYNLNLWAQERGVELVHSPGEDHGQTGDVEAMIGKIKTDTRTYLRDWDMDPFLGLLHMIHAHNTRDRVGGYAPCQWACGRFPTFDGRLFDSGLNVMCLTTAVKVWKIQKCRRICRSECVLRKSIVSLVLPHGLIEPWIANRPKR